MNWPETLTVIAQAVRPRLLCFLGKDGTPEHIVKSFGLDGTGKTLCGDEVEWKFVSSEEQFERIECAKCRLEYFE